jgi:hypothetical protein
MADPIGIRNNNPGNLFAGGGFDGESEGEGGFAAYPTPVAGGQALIKNLVAYNAKHGLDTVEGIVNRWAPATDPRNDVPAYVNAVSGAMGVQPDTQLNMQDPGTLAKLATAISQHEGNGGVYSADFYGALTQNNPELAAYIASAKLPSFLKQQTRSNAYRANPGAQGEPGSNNNDMTALDATWGGDPRIEEAAQLQGAADLAARTRWAGMGESFVDSLVNNTVTGAVVDLTQRGAGDPTFKIGDEQFNAMSDKGVLANKQLSDYVSGAVSQDDFNRRMELATERLDYFGRASNKQGLSSAGNTAAALIGGMADPIAVIATMGGGWAANMARVDAALTATATAQAARGSFAMAAAGGAAANVGIGQVVALSQNQKYTWGDLLGQGIQGAALGALGHFFTPMRDNVRPGEVAPVDPVLRTAGENLHETSRSILNQMAEKGSSKAFNPLADIDDPSMPAGLIGADRQSVRPPESPLYEVHALDLARNEREQLLPVAGNLADPGVISSARQSLADLEANAPDLQEMTKAVQAAQGVSYKQARAIAKVQYASALVDQAETRTRLEGTIAQNTAAEQARARIQELDTHIASMEAERAAQGRPLTDRTPIAQAVAELNRYPRESIFAAPEAGAFAPEQAPRVKPVDTERAVPRTAGQSAVGEGRTPDVRRTFSGEGNQVGRFSRGETGGASDAPIQNARYQDFVKQGVIEELHSSQMENVPKDAKAMYVPEDGKVYVLRDRLTPADEADPTGLIMHEIGVHYGLEGALGTEQYTRVLGEIDRLSQTDLKVKAALESVPKDTPANLRLEETLGYLAEQNPKLGAAARIVAGIRTWLRDNVPLFKNLGMTANEILRLVAGSVEAARAGTTREGGLRYSRATPVHPSNATPTQLRLTKREQDFADAARKWDETDADRAQQRGRLKAWYDTNRPAILKKGEEWIDSPGLILQRSASKVARYLGATMFEDASGIGKRVSNTVAIQYERLLTGYKWAVLPTIQENLTKGFTASEKAQYMFGFAKAAEDRVWRQVAEERLAHRASVEAKVKYTSSAPDHIQKLAKALDDFYDKTTADGRAVGNTYADNIRGAGFVGHIPYVWQWEKITNAFRSDRIRYEAFRENMTQQYRERIVDPAVEELTQKGTATPQEIADLTKRLNERVDAMIDTKMKALMKDPETRTTDIENHFESVATDILKENWDGATINSKVLSDFRTALGDVIKDRTRTEMDLLRTVNGVSLLDFMEHNGERMVVQGSHRFASQNAMASHGFHDLADTNAALNAAMADGAGPEDLKALSFGFRAFGFGQLKNAERSSFTTLRNFVYSAIMGKLGLSVLADASNMIASVGMGGFFRAVGGSVSKNTEFLKQLAVDAPGLLGQDYRIHSLTPDVSATGRMMIGEGSNLNRLSQRAAQFVSYINLSNSLGKMLHRAFLPILAEDVLRTVKGENGGMTRARLADLGIDSGMMDRIKGQLDQFDAARERGGKINWDQWTDQEAADALINGFHRGTFQTFQRAMVGEAPMWLSESSAGSLFGQFRRYGIVSTEKQLARNVSIGDMNTVNAFVFGTAWAAMLYYARLQLNTLGKSDAEKEKFIADNTKGGKLASGVFTLMNMSGLLPDTINMGELLFGGKSFNQAGSPVAAMGYLGDITGAAQSGVALATGSSTSQGNDARSLMRIVPGANSLLGTYWQNRMISKE